MKRAFSTLGFCFLLGCAPIQHTSRLSQPTNKQLAAGLGETFLTISKEKNLPNAFGASDIFGRKTPTGMTTVQYLGLRGDTAVFRRSSVIVETGATTMNSTPLIIDNSETTHFSGNIRGEHFSGTATTSAPPTVIPARPPQWQVMDQGSVEVMVELGKGQRQLLVEGRTITIASADNTRLVYSISE